MSEQCCQHHQNEECNCGEDCNCDCTGCGGEGAQLQRRFQTKEEQTAMLEAYLRELKLETQAVEEHLADLRK